MVNDINKRIQLTMNPELLEKVDNFAKSSGIPRSAAISVLCADMLEQKEFMKRLPALLEVAQAQLMKDKEQDK